MAAITSTHAEPIDSAEAQTGRPDDNDSSAGRPSKGRCEYSNLDDCSDRLGLNDKPLCESYTQILRLRRVDDLEKLDPSALKKTDLITPIIAAQAQQSHVEKYLACSFYKTRTDKSADKIIKTISSNIWNNYQNQYIKNCSRIRKPAFCHDIELAIAINYEQCWHPRGYSRGELLNSISLAPGEELQLEFFTYDRHKIERERENEGFAESSESGTVTSRSTTEVVNTTQFKVGVGAEAKGEASLSLKEMDIPADVGGSIGANFQSELSNALTISQSNLNEATISASNTVRNTRKTRIVETSESGTESRNTRKIVNENRCHTVNYDYFEILENYWVEVHPKSAEYVVKVPLPDIGPITADWLLCHEYPLRMNLLDGVYAAGFDAAKILLTAEVYKTLISDPPVVPPTAPDSGDTSTSTNTAPPDPVGDQLRILLAAIKDASERLQSVDFSGSDWEDIFSFNETLVQRAMTKANKIATRNFILSVYSGIFDRIDELHDHRDEPGETLIHHFDIFLNQMTATGVMNIVSRPLKWEALQMLVFTYDDEGLIGAIRTANMRIGSLQAAINASNAAAVALPDTAQDTTEGAEPAALSPRDRLDQEFGLAKLAEAQIELDRLICHINDNLDYYLNLIYLSKGLSGLNEILESCPQIAHMVETRVINISSGYAIFVLNRIYQQRYSQDRLNAVLEKISEEADNGVCITLPTKGTVLEARLGECSACEPFIEKHRVLDLRAKGQEIELTNAKIRQQKAEADRYEKRLAQDPPLLDDPSPPAPDIDISVASPQTDG